LADNGFTVAVHNRSSSKVHDTVARAATEGLSDKILGREDMKDFVNSLARPRKVIMLVKAGAPVDATISALRELLDEGDLIIDGGNEFYTNTERRGNDLAARGILYMGMGVSGGEEGARYGPSLMPGGKREAWDLVETMFTKVAAQVDGNACVTYIGPGGAGNYVKMVHNGIEYGDMQLIGEAYDLLRNVGGMSPDEIAAVFDEWNSAELQSFLVEITAQLLKLKDDVVLEARYISALKPDRVSASKVLKGPSPTHVADEAAKKQLVDDVRRALYASKICSYAQGMNLIRQAGLDGDWGLDLGRIAQIWKGGCIIRAKFLDRINAAYTRNPSLESLLVDAEFATELDSAQESWRRLVTVAVSNGIAVPSMSGSLAYYDSYRRAVLPSSQMVQAQRDFFGSHTYKRLDDGDTYHTRWSSDGVSVKID